MDCSPATRRRRETTSCEVMPEGLSMMRSPFTLSTIGADRDFASSDSRLRRKNENAETSEVVRGALADEGEEFVAGVLPLEDADHGRCHCGGVLLLDAAHHHAEVAGFDDHADALRRDDVLNGVGNLAGEAFLHLQAAGEDLDEAG